MKVEGGQRVIVDFEEKDAINWCCCKYSSTEFMTKVPEDKQKR